MKQFLHNYIQALLLVLLFQGCKEPVYTPKPRMFPRVKYPTKNYQSFNADYCDHAFEFPVYATIKQDTVFFDEKPSHECWYDLIIPELNARVHCTYSPIKGKIAFEKLRDDAFRMAYKHQARADFIDEFEINKPNGVKGFVFNVEGPSASPFQFYLTDESDHFLRGALYFNTQSKTDSLAPVIEFVKQDIMHMINTFSW